MEFRPQKHHKSLALASLVLAPVAILQLMKVNSIISFEIAAIAALLAGILSVITLVQHWRYS